MTPEQLRRSEAITAALDAVHPVGRVFDYNGGAKASEPGAVGAAPARGQHLVGGAVMAHRTCSIEGCGRPHRSRGWCELHYCRWRAHGDPMFTVMVMDHPEVCTVEGCDRPYLTRGWCHMHYVRWRRHGDPGKAESVRVTGDPIARLLASADETPDGCIVATTGLNRGGYRSISWTDDEGVTRNGIGHRLMYAHAYGPIPEGMHCHHVCRNRACINPEHLQLLTASEHRRLHVDEAK